MSTQASLDAIKAERGRVYGDPAQSHENIGLGWTGLIQQHYGIKLPHALPSWLVEQMLCSLKLQRAARVYHKDNYDDLANYSQFANDEQSRDARAQIPASVGSLPGCESGASVHRLDASRKLHSLQ